MGNVHPLPKTPTQNAPLPLSGHDAKVSQFEARCALCGKRLSAGALRHRLVPPQSARKTITTCHTCAKAAIGEGYRLVV